MNCNLHSADKRVYDVNIRDCADIEFFSRCSLLAGSLTDELGASPSKMSSLVISLHSYD